MRTMPRIALPALIAAALLVGCTSASQSKVTQPSTLAVGGSSSTSSTMSSTGSTAPSSATTATTSPASTMPPTTLAPTTVLPTSTAPAGASVSIARGAFLAEDRGSCKANNCKYVQITASGWKKNQPLSVTCYSDSGSSGPFPKFADASGNLSAGTTCFFGNVTNVYVEIDGVRSNVVSPWKDW